MLANDVPASAIDLFADDVLLDPFESYRTVRDHGPAVWSSKYDLWLIGRYKDVKSVLSDHQTFVSGEGVGLFPPAVEALRGTLIASDPPEHTGLRKVLAARMSLKGLRALESDVQDSADRLIDELLAKGDFDAVPELAQRFPLMIVADLIGLPRDERHDLLSWADAGFNTFGPPNDRSERSLAKMGEMFEYIGKLDADPSRLVPGSMGREIYEAAERGELRFDQCGRLMAAYLMAGMDTTIASIANIVHLFAGNPAEWRKLRDDPRRVPLAYNEVLRFESPALAFRRTLSRDFDMQGVQLRKGDKALVLYASANRDERKWDDPDRFDVSRQANDHLALGFGIHNCAGQGLARLEAHALLNAMVRKVDHFETGDSKRHVNNVIRSLSSLPARMVPA